MVGHSATVNVASYFSDPDGDALTYTATSSNSAVATVALSGTSATITGVAAGTATVTVTARDPAGLSATMSAAITVEEPNSPPVALVESDSATMELGDTVQGDVSELFEDPDDDSLTFTVTTTDANVVATSLVVSHVTIAALSAGTATVTFAATDPRGQSASVGLAITVVADDTCARGSETSLAMGDSIRGILSEDDEDCFTIQVGVGGGRAPFRITAHTEGFTDTEGVLFDSNYNEISSSDDDGEGVNFQVAALVNAGTYFVRVTGFFGEPGEYLLKVDDHGDSPATATAVADCARGETSPMRVTSTSSRSQCRCQEYWKSPRPVPWMPMTLYDDSGDVLATDDDVRVEGSTSGNYVFRAEVPGGGADDHSCTRGSETPLAMGDSIPGTLSEDDEDCFAVQVGAEGGRAPFRVTAYTEGDIDAEGELYDSNYNRIADDSDSGERFNFQIAELVSAGRYVVRVTEWQGRQGDYVLKVDDHGDSPATATAVADSARGRFARAGNVDFFEVPVPAMGVLEVSTTLAGMQISACSVWHTPMIVAGPMGQWVAQRPRCNLAERP